MQYKKLDKEEFTVADCSVMGLRGKSESKAL